MNVQCSFWSVVTKGNIRIMVRNWRIGARDAKQSPTNFQLWQSPQFSLSTYFHYTFIHTHTGREQLFEEKEKRIRQHSPPAAGEEQAVSYNEGGCRVQMVKSRAGLHGPRAAPGRSGFPDQFEIGAAESIRSAYTPLKPRTDEQPCHLSECDPQYICTPTSQTGFIWHRHGPT